MNINNETSLKCVKYLASANQLMHVIMHAGGISIMV